MPQMRVHTKTNRHSPEWQCPACQVVYDKASARNNTVLPTPSIVSSSQSSIPTGMLKTAIVLALAACIVYFGYPFFSGITITRETSGTTAETSPIIAPDKTVLLYSRAGCGYCDKAKLFLQKHNVAFEEIDVNTSERGKEDFKKLGAIGTPILIVADMKVVGFDESELKAALKSKGLLQ